MTCDRWRWTNRNGEAVPFEDDAALARFIAAHDCEKCGSPATAHPEVVDPKTPPTFRSVQIFVFDNEITGEQQVKLVGGEP